MNSPVSDLSNAPHEPYLTPPLYIWAVGCDGKFIASEGDGLRFLGLRSAKVVGRSIWSVLRDCPELLLLVRSALRGERATVPYRKRESYFKCHCAPLLDESLQVRGVLGICVEASHPPADGTSPNMADLYRHISARLPVVTYVAEARAPFSRLYVSSQFHTATGLAPQTWIDAGEEWLEQVRMEDRVATLQHLQAAVEQPSIVSGELRLINASGGEVFMEEHLLAIRDTNGQPVCVQGILLDVTARRLAESQSAASGAYLQLLIESAHEGISTVRSDGYFDYANPRMATLLEIDADQILTQHVSEFLLPGDQEMLCSRFERRMAGVDEPLNHEIRIQTAKGNVFWAEVQITPLKVAEQFIGSLVMLRDITQRKTTENDLAEIRAKLEFRVHERTREVMLANQVLEEQILRAREVTERLQESEDRWRSLVENAPQYVVLLDREGRFQFINRVAGGWDIKQVLGTKLLDAIPPHNVPKVKKILKRVFEHGERQTYEIDGYGHDRQMTWYSVSIGPIFSKTDSQVTMAVLIAADVTERKRAEEALQKRQLELEHISRLNVMGALSAELAHELNQPLEAISAYASASLRSLKADEIHAPRVETALQKISQQATRAGEIIRKILNFVRKRDNPRELTDINSLIHDIASFADLEARKHQVAIEFELADDVPEVKVKRVQIEQVLLNLFLNALDAILIAKPESPLIRIISRSVAGEDVEVSVADNGCGFDEKAADEMFQPFYSTKGQGLGMGLSISRTIIDEHGGSIWAKSEVGKGSIFTFTLPGGSQKIDLVRKARL